MSDVYFFSASWCGPCKTFGPIVESVAAEYPDITIEKMDIDTPEGQVKGFECDVMSIPTLVTRYHHELKGATTEGRLRMWLDGIREQKKIQEQLEVYA